MTRLDATEVKDLTKTRSSSTARIALMPNSIASGVVTKERKKMGPVTLNQYNVP